MMFVVILVLASLGSLLLAVTALVDHVQYRRKIAVLDREIAARRIRLNVLEAELDVKRVDYERELKDSLDRLDRERPRKDLLS